MGPLPPSLHSLAPGPSPLSEASCLVLPCSRCHGDDNLLDIIELLSLSGFTLVAMAMAMFSSSKALALCAACGQDIKVGVARRAYWVWPGEPGGCGYNVPAHLSRQGT